MITKEYIEQLTGYEVESIEFTKIDRENNLIEFSFVPKTSIKQLNIKFTVEPIKND